MIWFLPLAIYILSLVVQSLWQRKYAQSSELPESFPPALSYVLVVMPVSLIAGLCMSHKVDWRAWLILLLVVEGLFIGLFNWFMFAALRVMTVAKFEMIFQIYIVVTIVLGWVLLNEDLTLRQIVGALFLVTAAYIALQVPKNSEQELRPSAKKKTVIMAVCAAISLGIGLVAEKAALRHMDLGGYFIFGFATQTLAVLFLAAKDGSIKNLQMIHKSDLVQTSIMGVLATLVGFSYVIAIRLADNISLITALSAISLPLMVAAGYVVLREKEDAKKMWAATILGLIGLVLAAT